MTIMVKHVRIHNFRSLAYADVPLGMCNVLIGQNNSGKSNFLKAIDVALNGNRNVSEQDIFVRDGERLSSDKSALIDILIVPIDENNEKIQHFSDFWTGVFTDKWITTDETNGDFVGIRTIVSFDIKRNDYALTRKPIVEWGNSIEEAICGKKLQFGLDILEYINSFFMDAHRDVSEDIKNKKSYIGRATSSSDLSDELTEELETQLNTINGEIIKNIPSLNQTSDKISAIGKTLGNQNSSVQIEPLARKISDLHKGMDVTFKDGSGACFSVAQHGLGTRSWISFLTLGAYIDWSYEQLKSDDEDADNYVMLTMEEPEAHLHPQAQRQLYSQMLDFNGQKIISTHSPNVLSQAKLADIIHFYKIDGETKAARLKIEDYTPEDINKIKREVINTRGDLLFSTAIVLCEGITEEQALPIYFKEYFDTEPIFCGINIIGIGGQNYKSFLKLIKDLGIKWFIFSDGEPSTIKTVKKAVKVISDADIQTMPNVIILENNEDYELHLLNSGCGSMMVDGINKSHADTVRQQCDEEIPNDEKTFFEEYVENNNHTSCGRYKTDKPPCEKCGQDIYEDNIRDYDGDDGYNRAIYDCCTGRNSKARYACYIADEIVAQNMIPPKVRQLFEEMARQLNLSIRREYCENEPVTQSAEDC